MVRNLMMIFGLTLAVAAFGCDSDSTGDGASTGDGGSGGSGAAGAGGSAGAGGAVTPGAACTNATDLPKVCSDEITAQVTTCATTAAGAAAATSTCLQADPPALSADCADCYGAQTQCIRDNCVFAGDSVCLPPALPTDPLCEACRIDSGCDPGFDACAGDLAAACEQ